MPLNDRCDVKRLGAEVAETTCSPALCTHHLLNGRHVPVSPANWVLVGAAPLDQPTGLFIQMPVVHDVRMVPTLVRLWFPQHARVIVILPTIYGVLRCLISDISAMLLLWRALGRAGETLGNGTKQ